MKFSHNKSIGLLISRVIIGAIFIMSGYMKLSDITGTAGFFAQMGFGVSWVYIVGLVELLGGISFVIGYGSKVSAALLSIVMIVAMYAVRGMGLMGILTPLAVFASTVSIMFTGPGKYSIGSSCGCPVGKGTCPADGGCSQCSDVPKK